VEPDQDRSPRHPEAEAVTAPKHERAGRAWLFKAKVRVRFALACLTSRHVVIAWSPRLGGPDSIGYVGLDQKLLHQAESAHGFLIGRFVLEANVRALCGEGEP